jgi:hypothetical protein
MDEVALPQWRESAFAVLNACRKTPPSSERHGVGFVFCDRLDFCADLSGS